MTTRREQIIQAIVAAIAAGTTPVYRSRVEPLARNETPAIVVEPLSDNATQTTLGRLDWSLTLRVMVIVRGDGPDQLADPIIADIHQRIMADMSIGGLAVDLQPGSTSYDLTEGDQPVGVISQEFTVLYKTNLQNLSTV